jgi:hypothetical protein
VCECERFWLRCLRPSTDAVLCVFPVAVNIYDLGSINSKIPLHVFDILLEALFLASGHI